MESLLHLGVSDQFLLCSLEKNATFHILSVSSSPSDKVTSDVCDTSSDPVPIVSTECVVVIAEMSMTAFFPSSNRRELQQTFADQKILDESGEYLTDSMANGEFIGGDIVQVSFQGFVNFENGGDGTASDANIFENAIVGEGSNSEKTSDIAIGSSVMGVTALILLVVVVMSVQRGRRHRNAYLRHLEDLSLEGSEECGPGNLTGVETLANGKVQLVVEEFDDFFSLGEIRDEDLPASHPNVHHCASATCPICRHRVLAPTFLTTSLSRDDTEDLRPRQSRFMDDCDRLYCCDDTVIL
jgi:hypothetical protein